MPNQLSREMYKQFQEDPKGFMEQRKEEADLDVVENFWKERLLQFEETEEGISENGIAEEEAAFTAANQLSQQLREGPSGWQKFKWWLSDLAAGTSELFRSLLGSVGDGFTWLGSNSGWIAYPAVVSAFGWGLYYTISFSLWLQLGMGTVIGGMLFAFMSIADSHRDYGFRNKIAAFLVATVLFFTLLFSPIGDNSGVVTVDQQTNRVERVIREDSSPLFIWAFSFSEKPIWYPNKTQTVRVQTDDWEVAVDYQLRPTAQKGDHISPAKQASPIKKAKLGKLIQQKMASDASPSKIPEMLKTGVEGLSNEIFAVEVQSVELESSFDTSE